MTNAFEKMASPSTVVIDRLATLDELLRDAVIDPLLRVRTWKVGREAYEAVRILALDHAKGQPGPLNPARVELSPFAPPGMAFGFCKDGQLLVMVRTP